MIYRWAYNHYISLIAKFNLPGKYLRYLFIFSDINKEVYKYYLDARREYLFEYNRSWGVLYWRSQNLIKCYGQGYLENVVEITYQNIIDDCHQEFSKKQFLNKYFHSLVLENGKIKWNLLNTDYHDELLRPTAQIIEFPTSKRIKNLDDKKVHSTTSLH